MQIFTQIGTDRVVFFTQTGVTYLAPLLESSAIAEYTVANIPQGLTIDTCTKWIYNATFVQTDTDPADTVLLSHQCKLLRRINTLVATVRNSTSKILPQQDLIYARKYQQARAYIAASQDARPALLATSNLLADSASISGRDPLTEAGIIVKRHTASLKVARFSERSRMLFSKLVIEAKAQSDLDTISALLNKQNFSQNVTAPSFGVGNSSTGPTAPIGPTGP